MLVNKDHFQKQLDINPKSNKFYVLVKTDPFIYSYNLTELKEELFQYYDFIEYRGIFPVVCSIEQTNKLYNRYVESYVAWVNDSSWSNNGEPWNKENFLRLIQTDERFKKIFKL